MLLNIIIFFIILITLMLILQYSRSYKEGFFNFPVASHNNYVDESQAKFNPLTNNINLTNPVIPMSPQNSDAFKKALGGLSVSGTPTVHKLDPLNDFVLPNKYPSVFKKAQSCESYGPTCAAFDNKEFAENCGVSFDTGGTNASGNTYLGGLYISPDVFL